MYAFFAKDEKGVGMRMVAHNSLHKRTNGTCHWIIIVIE